MIAPERAAQLLFGETVEVPSKAEIKQRVLENFKEMCPDVEVTPTMEKFMDAFVNELHKALVKRAECFEALCK